MSVSKCYCTYLTVVGLVEKAKCRQKSLGNGKICFALTKGFPVRTIDIYMLHIIEKIFPSTFKQ